MIVNNTSQQPQWPVGKKVKAVGVVFFLKRYNSGRWMHCFIFALLLGLANAQFTFLPFLRVIGQPSDVFYSEVNTVLVAVTDFNDNIRNDFPRFGDSRDQLSFQLQSGLEPFSSPPDNADRVCTFNSTGFCEFQVSVCHMGTFQGFITWPAFREETVPTFTNNFQVVSFFPESSGNLGMSLDLESTDLVLDQPFDVTVFLFSKWGVPGTFFGLGCSASFVSFEGD